jgi:chromosome segregation ATPase
MPKDPDLPIDAEIKCQSLGGYEIAWLIAHWPAARETKEARDLLKRWKALHAVYAKLSRRYSYLVNHIQSLRLTPGEIERSYAALDAQFDELTPAIAALHADLKKWEQGLEKTVMTVDEMREEIARAERRHDTSPMK